MKQLAFKGIKVRHRARFALEKEVHCMIADDLRRWCKPPWLWAHYPAGEHRDEITGALLKRMGTKPGWSDFLLMAPGPQVYALELKRQGRKPTPSQSEFLAAMRAINGHAAWADNYPDAIAILVNWGAIPDRIRVQL